MQSRQYILHSFRGESLCLGQMVKNDVDNNDSSHGGTNIVLLFICLDTKKIKTRIRTKARSLR